MKENKSYKILRQLFDHTIPKKYRPIVRNWLISDTDIEEKEEALHTMWTVSPSDSDISLDKPLKRTWEKIESFEQKVSRRFFFIQVLRYTGVILLTLFTGLTVWLLSENHYKDPDIIEYFVPNGELQTIVLPDGSSVQVNAGSLLVYSSTFSKAKRQVYLSGEANFSIEPDKKRPFIVRTGGLNVEVLGTKFNIESYPGSGFIATTLEHGSVKVYKEANPEEAIVMKPSEQLIYLSHEDRFSTAKVDVADYSAWTNGELRFINKSLDEILLIMQRKYDVRFLIDPSINGTDQYTMKFKSHESIEDAMYVLSEILGNITYEREGQTIRLHHKGKEVTR